MKIPSFRGHHPIRSTMAVGTMGNVDGLRLKQGNGMPLTEYSANPSDAPNEKSNVSDSIPKEFLLPDGHPDVCWQWIYILHDIGLETLLVPSTHPHFSRLRCRQGNPHDQRDES